MKIRTKTAKKFTSEQLLEVASFVKDFTAFPEALAKELMEWATFNPAKFIEINKWNMPVKNIEQLSSLLGDMRANYLEANPDCKFLNKDNLPKELLDHFTQNIIVAGSIYELCDKTSDVANSAKLSRVCFLLKSEKEENRYGGMREIGASPDQSKFFLDFTEFIADFLEKMVKDKSAGEKTLTETTEDASPEKVEEIEESVHEADVAKDLKSNSKEEAPAKQKLPFAALVLQNKETFQKLLEAKEAVEALNTDVLFFNEENITKLSKLIEAMEAF